MASLTYPFDGLISFQKALSEGTIMPTQCKVHPDLSVLLDNANGSMRLTYALISNGVVKATCVYIGNGFHEETPCFEVGYAVALAFRKRGLAKEALEKSIDEMRHGFKRHMQQFYIEAIVERDNDASNRVASQFISSNPTAIVDGNTGLPAYQYFRLIDCQ